MMSKWVTGKVVQIKYWTDHLFSLIIHAPINSFIAGQFTKLGLEKNGVKVQRAYSYVNSPSNKDLEFYLIMVPEGKLSPRLHAIQPGEHLMITKDSVGYFIIDNIPPCQHLWMLATGTALGPYLSILEHGTGLTKFNYIVLIHAVRFAKDLNYLPYMLKLQKRYNGMLRILTIVSREKLHGSLNGRIPNLIADGSLESSIGLSFHTKSSHVMLCGNPQMVIDTQHILQKKFGMRKHFKHNPGHITSERYW